MNVSIKTLIGLLFVVLLSCQQKSGIQLRIENTSTIDFDDISVNNISFGALKANDVSDYLPFESIYKSEYVQVVIDGRTIKFVPEEFRSDEFYDEGRYRYLVDIVQKKWLSVKFVEE